jgi:hypothetical protein
MQTGMPIKKELKFTSFEYLLGNISMLITVYKVVYLGPLHPN